VRGADVEKEKRGKKIEGLNLFFYQRRISLKKKRRENGAHFVGKKEGREKEESRSAPSLPSCG